MEQGTSATEATDKVPPIAIGSNSTFQKNAPYHPSFSITSSSIPVSTNMTLKEQQVYQQASLESNTHHIQHKNNIHFVQIKRPRVSKMQLSTKEGDM